MGEMPVATMRLFDAATGYFPQASAYVILIIAVSIFNR